MTAATVNERRFYRNTDRAILGGVCAGLAEYFGFNLRVTRLLAIIALFAAPPFAIVGYFAIVVLVPAAPPRPAESPADQEFRRNLRSSPAQTMSDVRGRFRALDRRLQQLEKHVTSSRYQLDKEFSKLKD